MSVASPPATDWLRVATLAELQRRGVMVVRGADRPIAVFPYREPHGADSARAVDNRCPHLGFPLHRGSIRDGILVCHWHHARFDLCSGCTFDLFADDVPAFDTRVEDGVVYVRALPRGGDPLAQNRRRLREGMEQNIPLIQAKALLGLLRAGAPVADVVREVGLFGLRHRDGWASGMTILTAMANLHPYLQEETAYLALYQGTRRAAADTAGMAPRRDRHPLHGARPAPEQLAQWLASFTEVRHRDGAERVLLTAIASGAPPAELAALLFTAATQRFYADTGHLLDFCNKACELLDLIGWEHAPAVLPTVSAQLVQARGGEEMNAWRYPVDLVPPLREAEAALPELLAEGELRREQGERWSDEPGLAATLLEEDPLASLRALGSAAAAGATPAQLGAALAYAAGLRVARFGAANEFGDWVTALHTFSYCNALHAALQRAPTPGVARGLLHGAAAVYLDRFLNVPPARLPGERGYHGPSLEEEPADAAALRERFLLLLDQRADLEAPARVVARYLRLGHPPVPLYDTLTRAVVREDADFHTFQMVEAAVRQHRCWEGRPQAEHFLLAAARYIAAHSPTQRAQLQTAQIALRLHRGESLHEEADDPALAPAAE